MGSVVWLPNVSWSQIPQISAMSAVQDGWWLGGERE